MHSNLKVETAYNWRSETNLVLLKTKQNKTKKNKGVLKATTTVEGCSQEVFIIII